MPTMHMRGAVGELVCWYQRVALLRAWTLHSVGAGLELTAEIESVDAHRVTQRPLTFRVPRAEGKKPWRWPVVALHIAASGSSLTATLGPQE